MKTQGKNTAVSNTSIDNEKVNNAEQPIVNGLPVGTGFNDEVKEQPQTTHAVEATATQKQQEPKVELPKVEAKQVKPALNLDETIKLLESLHTKKIQRDKLIGTITNLEKFELDLEKESDETSSNYYQGCVLKITDDDKNDFSTKNPVIIKKVADFVKDLCIDKLGEIEASIIIPA